MLHILPTHILKIIRNTKIYSTKVCFSRVSNTPFHPTKETTNMSNHSFIICKSREKKRKRL